MKTKNNLFNYPESLYKAYFTKIYQQPYSIRLPGLNFFYLNQDSDVIVNFYAI
jgi:hypothetical protein